MDIWNNITYKVLPSHHLLRSHQISSPFINKILIEISKQSKDGPRRNQTKLKRTFINQKNIYSLRHYFKKPINN